MAIEAVLNTYKISRSKSNNEHWYRKYIYGCLEHTTDGLPEDDYNKPILPPIRIQFLISFNVLWSTGLDAILWLHV